MNRKSQEHRESELKPQKSTDSITYRRFTVHSIIWKGPPPEPKKKRTLWITRAMAEEMSRVAVIESTLKDALIYIFFLVAVTISTYGRRDPAMFYISRALQNQFVENAFSVPNKTDMEMTFSDITEHEEFWNFAETLLIDSFDWETYYGDVYKPPEKAHIEKKILFESKLLGVPRIRQVRVKREDCNIPTGFKQIKQCYGHYSNNNEDIQPFGLRKATAWVYSSAEATKSSTYSAKINTYGAGGYYQDLTADRQQNEAIIHALKQNLWITRNTRAVFIDFSIFNGNLDLFSICKLILEFPPCGGIIPSHYFVTVKLTTRNYWEYVTFVAECIVYVMVAYFFLEELREMIYFKFRYCLQFWSYIDLAVIILSIASLILTRIILPNIEDTIKEIKNNPTKYGNMETIAEYTTYNINITAIMLFFSYIKVFKYLNFNKTMGQLNVTLKRCALDIVGFSVMFFTFFWAYAALGNLVFGTQVDDFKNFGVSMFTLLRTLLGDFDYEAIEEDNKILAPLYFVTFIFFVFFVLLNMFLAIINDSYADVKTEIPTEPDELQMYDYLKKNLWKILIKLGCNLKIFQDKPTENPTVKTIKETLKKCGFNDLEIEMFFARYVVHPFAEVTKYDHKELLQEWEKQSMAKEDKVEADNLLHGADFIVPESRFDRIESNMKDVASNIDKLIKKLEKIEKETQESEK